MFAQVYLVALLAFFAQAALASTCTRSYKVQEGDYCDKIAREQSVPSYQLFALNSNINQGCTNLVPDETLCLGTDGEDCRDTYLVKSGDTCDHIAATYELNMTILLMNNPQLNEMCDIYVGEVLCVSNTVQVPAIPSNGIAVTMGGSTSASPSSTPPNNGANNDSNDESGLPTSTTHTTHGTPANPSASATSSTPAATPTPTQDDEDDDQLPLCDY
jgi:LysM repeat protein